MNILIVDDDPLQASLLVDIFNINNYSAVGVHSGTEALQLMKKKPYEVVLSDIRMPEMDGVELCRKVKATHPEIVFILMTAYAGDELVMKGMQAGALITMSKPLEIKQLIYQITLLARK